jgi:diguanylate cyclase (GGDEF)-like protein
MSDRGTQVEALRSATIMIVDDDPRAVEALSAFLQAQECGRVVSTTDSREAQDLLARELPDVLLLDLAMPHVSGLEILRALRRNEALLHTPVIVITSATDDATRLKTLQEGASDFLTKPVNGAELVLRMGNLLTANAARDRLVRGEAGDRAVAEPRPAAPVPHVGGSRQGLKVMMVDDEPTTLEVIEAFLEGEGYSRFVSTTDSREALPMAQRERPDLVLLDLVMPHVGGFDILTAIRDDEALKHTPVIILTSATDGPTKLEALELGATDFLSKPVDPSELALRLRNTLAARAYQERLTYYDRLTDLPNRLLFLQQLESELRRAGREDTKCSVVHLGLNRFKEINDTLGISVGDALLKVVAERLERCSPSQPARVGGDEFSLVLPRVQTSQDAARIAKRLLEALRDPFQVEGQDLFLTASIGLAVSPDDGVDSETLLKHASVAASHAKRTGDNSYEFYRSSLNAESAERLSLESQLRGALECEELRLYYQPVLDVASGRIVGAEALMRWKHPELGLLLPGRFIHIAEQTDLVRLLGEWAIGEACRQSKSWGGQGLPQIRVSVNVSGRQFDTEGLIQTISNALAVTDMEPSQLVLELTERQIMENPRRTALMLAALKDAGLKIAIDDFGTGYSSLAFLKRFPLDELKIDRSFIQDLPGDRDDAAIVSAIIALAHNLGLRVVAEGVETPEQLEFLRERGCDLYQGFLFSRAIPAAEWPSFFKSS